MGTNPTLLSPSTVAIIIGAYEYPEHADLGTGVSFLNSAIQFEEYVRSIEAFALKDAQVLNLFNSNDEQSIQSNRITTFLDSRLRDTGGSLDIIVYYVGHGYFAGDDYFLALRNTRKDDPYSGYLIKALAHTLRNKARQCRKFLFLDCCFAAQAVAEFQGAGAVQAMVRKTSYEFEGRDPGRGTALLCAASPRDPARAPVGQQCTMFTAGLMGVLRAGQQATRLTLYELGARTYDSIKSLFPNDDPVRPEVHSPHQPEGDIAAMPFFPTIGGSPASVEPNPELPQYADALDTRTFLQSERVIRCVVVNAERVAGDHDLPLHEHVRRAWEYHGQEIRAAAAKYRTASAEISTEANTRSETDRVDLMLATLSVERAFVDTSCLERSVEAICKADVVVFDTTDFKQAGIMLLLGVRSVARRGVTICSVGGDYVIGGNLAVPFNLQMLNLAAHSAAQENEGIDPRDVIGKKMAAGFRELAELPHYLDLPAYDSVRLLGVSSNSYRSIQYYDQVLFLCPFTQEYSRTNWKRYLSKELSGKLQEHFRSKEVATANPRLVRLLDLSTPRLVAQTLYESIRLTDMCVVDWTALRANVMFEAGVRLATNPLGAIHIVEQRDGSMQLGESTPEHVKHLIALFKPLKYSCKPGATDVYRHMIESFERSLKRDNSSFDGLVYRTVGNSLEVTNTHSSVVAELARSANLLLSDDEESSGICPVLYHDVNKRILDGAQEAAAERRLAAWLYLERRFSDQVIRANDGLYAQFRSLGAQARRWLKKKPDAALDQYIKRRMQEIKESEPGPVAETKPNG